MYTGWSPRPTKLSHRKEEENNLQFETFLSNILKWDMEERYVKVALDHLKTINVSLEKYNPDLPAPAPSGVSSDDQNFIEADDDIQETYEGPEVDDDVLNEITTGVSATAGEHGDDEDDITEEEEEGPEPADMPEDDGAEEADDDEEDLLDETPAYQAQEGASEPGKGKTSRMLQVYRIADIRIETSTWTVVFRSYIPARPYLPDLVDRNSPIDYWAMQPANPADPIGYATTDHLFKTLGGDVVGFWANSLEGLHVTDTQGNECRFHHLAISKDSDEEGEQKGQTAGAPKQSERCNEVLTSVSY